MSGAPWSWTPRRRTSARASRRPSGALALGMYEHLERELDGGGFFHPPEKFRSMSQNLRVMLGRSAFTEQEVATFRGVITALSKGRGRVLERLAREQSKKR